VNDQDSKNGLAALFEQPLDIINIGLESFADELSEQNVTVVHLDWRPPANGDAELADLLSRLGV